MDSPCYEFDSKSEILFELDILIMILNDSYFFIKISLSQKDNLIFILFVRRSSLLMK